MAALLVLRAQLGRDEQPDAPKGVELIADPGTTLREGEKLSLECLVKSSNPAVLELQWWKNNHRTSGRIYGNRMEIGPLGRQHSGRYRCKARNKFGTTESKELTIDVQYPPKETKSPFRSRTIKENDTITLECSFIAKPPITKYEWYKKPSTSAIGSQKQLHFQAIRPSDSGTYYCQVYNPIGGSNSSLVMLDVHYPPKEPQISFSRSTVQGKDAVSLHCWSTARPPITHYEWYKCPAEDIFSSQQELHFQAIQPNDSGGYYCKAYNPIGQSNSSVLTLNIHGADVCN
ncbi:hypothetical protein JRQ81_011558 [Phrynocephalus forsythii]|uniref:Ig-like domain-containing protein n=1 Tax=Phrynocephalus forsythii TaxID=171643 RepID=A0A9Q0X6Z1_9SAUR|nr:hypothetical protein JRQ81_011558 [Phrynocephalus forsythii]